MPKEEQHHRRKKSDSSVPDSAAAVAVSMSAVVTAQAFLIEAPTVSSPGQFTYGIELRS